MGWRLTSAGTGCAMIWHNLFHRGIKPDPPGILNSKQVVKFTVHSYYSLFGHLFKGSKKTRVVALDLSTRRALDLYKSCLSLKERNILETEGTLNTMIPKARMNIFKYFYPLKVKTVFEAKLYNKQEIFDQVRAQELELKSPEEATAALEEAQRLVEKEE